MIITGFCLVIVSKDAEDIVIIFEALGFEKRHTKTGIEGGENTAYAMKGENGNRLSSAIPCWFHHLDLLSRLEST